MYKIHHLNCGTMNPFGGRLVDGFSHGVWARMVSHCWVVEGANELIIVDTGFGEKEITDPHLLGSFLTGTFRPELTPANTLRQQLQKLGFSCSDVGHILLTQLGFGHAGAIGEFPRAKVHVMANELENARRPRRWFDRSRYSHQPWSDATQFVTYSGPGRKWFNFSGAHSIKGLNEDILIVPLPGQTWGQAGIAIRTNNSWMLHAGSSYLYRDEVDPNRPRCPILSRFYQVLTEVNHTQRVSTREKLRQLVKDYSHELRICSSNDSIEFTAYRASAGLWNPHSESNGPRVANVRA